MTTQDRIKSLHARYVAITNMDVPLTMQRIYQWEAWCAKGFKDEDLHLVVGMLREKIKRRIKEISCLKFHYLIGNTEWFEEDLGEAKALRRQQTSETPRQEILRSTGRPQPEPDTCRSAADIIAGMKAFEQFKALKASL